MAYKTKNIGFANILLYLMNNTAMISKIYCLSYKDSEWDIVIESVNAFGLFLWAYVFFIHVVMCASYELNDDTNLIHTKVLLILKAITIALQVSTIPNLCCLVT